MMEKIASAVEFAKNSNTYEVGGYICKQGCIVQSISSVPFFHALPPYAHSVHWFLSVANEPIVNELTNI